MGCVSSKLIRKELEREILCTVDGGEYFPNHFVSLTSSTYGALKLEKSDSPKPLKKPIEDDEEEEEEEETEVINTWELMGDLEEEQSTAASIRGKISPKPKGRSPLKRLSKKDSPASMKKFTPGKENRCNSVARVNNAFFTPSSISSSRRKSLSPLFDPDLVEAYEKELSQEQEQIKKIISQAPTNPNSSLQLDQFEPKCPPGGENSLVLYTTTLRGIRKTFEDCNRIRSILDSHQVYMHERDVSMDSGFKEELRKLMKEGFRIPLVFVKGRLIGGADEICKLEEEGRLGSLLSRIPRKRDCVCQGCGGIRFVMCSQCNGSCKVLDEGNVSVRCGECNENGLIHCPYCS